MTGIEARYKCPDCGSEDIGTIHDNLYYCDNGDCRASLYNPKQGRVVFYPVDYAIGFCPRCAANARDEFQGSAGAWIREYFECPECGWAWNDRRVLGPPEAREYEYDSLMS